MAASARPKKQFDRSIVDGPIGHAVWKVAWPTMLQNMIAGLQGIVDHAMVGHFVGYTGNAAIGVSWQIFLVVIVFIASMYSGMAVLVARFAGAGDHDKVNRVVYQAFICSLFIGACIMAPIGYVLSPWLLDQVNAAPAVKTEALPFLRLTFVTGMGMLMYFMLGGALRASGDARTPLYLGIVMTVLNAALNVMLIPGFGPIPRFGTVGAAIGTATASVTTAGIGLWLLFSHRTPIGFTTSMSYKPDWTIIRSLFKFGLPTGFQGVAMNLAGVLLLRFVGSLPQSAQAQAAYAVCYSQLFSFITWTSVGLMGATSAVAGQNLGAGRPERSVQAVKAASRIGLMVAAGIGALFILVPRALLGIFGMTDPDVLAIGTQLLRFLSISGFFITVALVHTGGLQGTGDTRSPFYISVISQVVLPVGLCMLIQSLFSLQAIHIWLAIVLGHFTRCTLSVLRFRQEKWRSIAVDIGHN